ncbi:hypothetical protein B0H19DRAFT_1079318 [Mycena capillaripes]|nr:hypothetical protein B0H19DRAFT_1079318 [Mycena capillaripes]
MQFNVVFIATALLASASLTMSATITGFAGAGCSGTQARVSECRLENVSVWEAARRSPSAIPVSPVKSSSSFLAEATILAPMARAWCLVVALDVEPRLPDLIGRALQSFKSLAVVATTETALSSISFDM